MTKGMPITAIINITLRVSSLEEELCKVRLKEASLLAFTRLGKWTAPAMPHNPPKANEE